MKLEYWSKREPKPDSDDVLHKACIGQGYVPAGCLLGGTAIMQAIKAGGGSPCDDCPCPKRDLCGGSPRKTAEEDTSVRVMNDSSESYALLRSQQIGVLEEDIGGE